MNRHGVNMLEYAGCLHPIHEGWVDWRNAAQDAGQGRMNRANGFSGEHGHLREAAPARIELQIPMRLVVRLIPYFDSFDHPPVLPTI